MLAYSQGGASSPAGASSNTGPATASAPTVENALGELGKGISSVGPSAMAVANSIKDLESKDASIAATTAGGLASIAQAKQSAANAKQIEAGMPSVMESARSAHTRAEADIAEGQARSARAEYDKKFAGFDSIVNRATQSLGAATDAVSIGRLLQGGRNQQRNQTMKEETHLRNQGRLGTGLK